jgi:hypothetical protein
MEGGSLKGGKRFGWIGIIKSERKLRGGIFITARMHVKN